MTTGFAVAFILAAPTLFMNAPQAAAAQEQQLPRQAAAGDVSRSKEARKHFEHGSQFIREHQYDRAIAEAREALRLNPSDPETHDLLGTGLDDKGEFDEAVMEFREALRLRPNYTEAHYDLGNALRDNGDVDNAILEYREAIRLNAAYSPPHDNLGRVLMVKQKWGEAILEFRQLLRLEPNDPYAHINTRLWATPLEGMQGFRFNQLQTRDPERFWAA